MNDGNEDLSPENERFSMQFTSADVQFYNIGAPRSNSKAHRWCQAIVTPAAKEVCSAAVGCRCVCVSKKKTHGSEKYGVGDFHQKVMNTVNGRTPANQLRLVVYPIIYRLSYMSGGCLGFLLSTVVREYYLLVGSPGYEVLSFTIMHRLRHVAHQRMIRSGQTNTAVEKWNVWRRICILKMESVHWQS